MRPVVALSRLCDEDNNRSSSCCCACSAAQDRVVTYISNSHFFTVANLAKMRGILKDSGKFCRLSSFNRLQNQAARIYAVGYRSCFFVDKRHIRVACASEQVISADVHHVALRTGPVGFIGTASVNGMVQYQYRAGGVSDILAAGRFPGES